MADLVEPASGEGPRRKEPGKPGPKEPKLLAQMRQNPKGNWNTGHLETVSKAIGLRYTPPKRGSHFKISSPHLPGILTVPSKRPIKPPYIKKFVALAEAHISAAQRRATEQ